MLAPTHQHPLPAKRRAAVLRLMLAHTGREQPVASSPGCQPASNPDTLQAGRCPAVCHHAGTEAGQQSSRSLRGNLSALTTTLQISGCEWMLLSPHSEAFFAKAARNLLKGSAPPLQHQFGSCQVIHPCPQSPDPLLIK